jgi:hypothetical protein
MMESRSRKVVKMVEWHILIEVLVITLVKVYTSSVSLFLLIFLSSEHLILQLKVRFSMTVKVRWQILQEEAAKWN